MARAILPRQWFSGRNIPFQRWVFGVKPREHSVIILQPKYIYIDVHLAAPVDFSHQSKFCGFEYGELAVASNAI